MQTDFPEPVVPAMSKCGIDDKSPIIGSPDIVLPSAMGRIKSLLFNFVLSNISLNSTFSLSTLGNSIPTELDPGITAILADSELVFLAMSSDKLIIFETLLLQQVQIHLK